MASILLVEDDAMNRDMLSRRLSRVGHEVLFATDGEEAVESLTNHHPDLVLMDMSLPVMSGWECTERIKADTATGAIPIIALTAHAFASDRDRALAAGCDDFASKPVDFDLLLDKIQRLLVVGN